MEVDIHNLTDNITSETISDDTNVNYDHPRTIHFVAIGVIIPVGLILNTLTLILFISAPHLRKTTTGHYLMALSMADTLFLIPELIRWLNTPNMDHINIMIDFMDHNDIICKLVYLFRYTANLASAWITVSITIERFITVAFPLKVSQISTPKVAKVVIGVIALLSLAMSLFTIWSVGVVPYRNSTACLITDDRVYNLGNWMSLRVGSLLLPGVLMAIFTGLIIFHLSHAKTTRKRSLSCSGSVLSKQLSMQVSRNNLEKQLTLMLSGVAVAFLVLRLPYTIMFYIQSYKVKIFPDLDLLTSYRIYYAYKMTDIFVSINYAINFFLYCLCGSVFRRQLWYMFYCKNKRILRRKLYRVSSSGRNTSSFRTSSFMMPRSLSTSRPNSPLMHQLPK